MAEEKEDKAPKIGQGALAAMGRAGLKELSQALVALPDSTVRPVEEAGMLGNPTPQMVTAEMGAGYSYHDMLAQRAALAPEKSNEKGIER